MDDPLQQLIKQHWPAAQKLWSNFMLLTKPVDCSEQHSIAQIHLGTRQVSLNFDTIREKGLEDCIEALLAHEIGHHVKYPGTMATNARLFLIERSLIPLDDYTLTNLFTDLMINEFIGRKLQSQLVTIYEAFDPLPHWKKDPAFVFYLTVYEELWQLQPGTLTDRVAGAYLKRFPGYRSDAQLLAEKLFAMEPNIYTQFLYFLSVFSRYIKPIEDEHPDNSGPYHCHADDPTPGDWAEAIEPNGAERAAVNKAVKEGWLTEEDRERMHGEGALERRLRGLPGMGTTDAEQVPEIMAAYYRRMADQFLVHPPPQLVMGEAVVPTTREEWQTGDPVTDIDWLGTLLRDGPELGAIQPQKRSRISESEGYDGPLWQPRIEIYLDVSGSMPDPRTSKNAMTLAALILATGAIRKGGWARALMYSTDFVRYWEWCRSEMELSQFLMHYFGAGTKFPFGVLRESAEKCRDNPPIRVIISDSDFDRNYDEQKKARQVMSEAIRESDQFIMLMHQGYQEIESKRYTELGAKVITLSDLENFPKLAADLTRVLFPEDSRQ